jgi:UDPglucose 6-dehydrogenase
MKVCVVGLWHLGTVTAACLAAAGHEVVGLDFDPETVQKLQGGQPPIFEPGLEELIQQGLSKGQLRFSIDVADSLRDEEVVWVAYDTPVDDEDRADVNFVMDRINRLFPLLREGTLVLISSQLPVGTTRQLEQSYAAAFPDKPVPFGYSPESLRLGKAIDTFTRPDRVVVGLRSLADRGCMQELLRPFSSRIEWMSVESAEMTKHALNAFLATSVTFINEIATLCERVGADAKEVERGLKSDARIGPRAYLSPGAAFAGGTLARDIHFLAQIGTECNQPTHLLSSVERSNASHKQWVHRNLQSILGDLRGHRVAVWGLTYKPGTDTLRRSASVELCNWLVHQGARVKAHDPAVNELPGELAERVELGVSPLSVLQDAAALVVATEWPEYQSLSSESVLAAMRHPLVLDPNRFLALTLGSDPRIKYVTVGKPDKHKQLLADS